MAGNERSVAARYLSLGIAFVTSRAGIMSRTVMTDKTQSEHIESPQLPT
jgi:hypothetical protein